MSAGAAGKRWSVLAAAARRRAGDTLLAGTPLLRHHCFASDGVPAVTVGGRSEADSEQALTVIRQEGAKDQPSYAGDDPAARLRFWRWPRWDRESVYLRARRGAGEHWEVRLRVFHDRFANTLESNDDATYSSQLRRSSFHSEDDDFK